MLPCDLRKRFLAPLLTTLLIGCVDTAADPGEPGADEARPAPGAAEPKGDPEAELRKVLAEIGKVRAEFETVEKKPYDLNPKKKLERGNPGCRMPRLRHPLSFPVVS